MSTSAKNVPNMETTQRNAVLDRLGNVQKDSAGIVVTDDMLTRDPDGNVITAPEHSDAVEMINMCLGRVVEPISYVPNGGDDSAPTIAFIKCGLGKLTMLQRQTVAVLAWHARNYYPAISRDMTHVQDLLIPSAFNEVDTTPRPHHVIHREFYTEEDAFRLAEVVERVFGAQVNVFEDDGKWYISVNSDCPELRDMEAMRRLHGILWAFDYYSFIPRPDIQTSPGSPEGISFLADCAPWQAKMDRKAATMANIEASLNAIQARLDDMATSAESLATGAELVANIEEHARRKKHSSTGHGRSAKKRTA